jgi:hypothetical protein
MKNFMNCTRICLLMHVAQLQKQGEQVTSLEKAALHAKLEMEHNTKTNTVGGLDRWQAFGLPHRNCEIGDSFKCTMHSHGEDIHSCWQ